MSAPSLPLARKLRVRVSSAGMPGGLELFTPGGALTWGGCEFQLDAADGAESDYWIVFANALPREASWVAPRNTLFIAGEPPAKKIYPRGFYKQFARLVDTHAYSNHPRVQLDALGLPWLVGLSWKQQRYTMGYDFLKRLEFPEKQNGVSVVCSTTAQTAGQRRRLKFLAALRQRLGDALVVFGKGFQPVDDKLEAILPYRYHLVLENSQSQHYWTEKLADAYLGWAFPLYVGCSNLSDYFAPESFEALDLDDVDGAAQAIRRLLAKPLTNDERTALRTARERVLEIYNPFARFAHWVDQFYAPAPKEQVVIQSAKAFRFMRGWLYQFQNRRFSRA
ncbi:MAG: glycosyltransferase family 10 [Verrucomicrobiae bacterium]|nr:glycosyltransferase family 10 [Verrucomicrobiae bacterium]